MSSLTPKAAFILDCMEPERAYDPTELRAFVPDTSMEGLRETMHELWVERHVERFGYSGWRRRPSTCDAGEVHDGSASVECPDVAKEIKAVKPEDLFDHDRFSRFFK